jgi:hypothetical protein
MTIDEIECIEEGGTEPTIALLRRLAAALDSDVRLPQDRTSAPYGSNPTQPDPAGLDVPGQRQRSSLTATFSMAERLNNRR